MKRFMLTVSITLLCLVLAENVRAQASPDLKSGPTECYSRFKASGTPTAEECYNQLKPNFKDPSQAGALAIQIKKTYLEASDETLAIENYVAQCLNKQTPMEKCYRDGRQRIPDPESDREALAQSIDEKYNGQSQKEFLVRKADGQMQDQNREDARKNRGTSPTGNAAGDGVTEKAEVTKSFLAGINISGKDQSFTFSGNLWGVLNGTTITTAEQYRKLQPGERFLYQSQFSVTAPKSFKEDDFTDLGGELKLHLYGDRNPGSPKWDRRLAELDLPKTQPFPETDDDAQTLQVLQQNREAVAKWLPEWEKARDEIANSPLITLSISRMPLSALLEGDTSKKINPKEPMWFFVLTADFLAPVAPEEWFNAKYSFTVNVKYQRSETPGLAHGDSVLQNNQRLGASLSGSMAWPRLVLSVEGEMEWDLETDFDTWVIATVAAIPMTDNVKFIVSYKARKNQMGETLVGFNLDTSGLGKLSKSKLF